MRLSSTFVDRIVRHVNRKNWWHVPPRDPRAYLKRGKFFASSFHEAEFWGRPLDEPQRVCVSKPLIGDEPTIEKKLFGRTVSDEDVSVEERWSLDARMKKRALEMGYDSIVLVSPKEFSVFRTHGKLPRRIELNVLNPSQR